MLWQHRCAGMIIGSPCRVTGGQRTMAKKQIRRHSVDCGLNFFASCHAWWNGCYVVRGRAVEWRDRTTMTPRFLAVLL